MSTLKDQYGLNIISQVAAEISSAWEFFDSEQFIHLASNGLEELELMDRGWHMSKALIKMLPQDFSQASAILAKSLSSPLDNTKSFGMQPFRYLPHSFFCVSQGMDQFEEAMQLQAEITQRFTAEFSLRYFIEKYPEKTLAQIHAWTQSPSEHIRRLCSEATRPRLPWSFQLKAFMHDPSTILPILEKLKDDPALYVRLSVANNLNDIGKDNPQTLVDTCLRWAQGADKNRQWLIRHALRSLIKKGNVQALAILGYSPDPQVALEILPYSKSICLGGEIIIRYRVSNRSPQEQKLLIDLQINFLKANGKHSSKIFKIKELSLAPKESTEIQKKVSFKKMTTRKHYPGEHSFSLQINGKLQEKNSFSVLAVQ